MRIRTAGGRISGMATMRTYCDGCAAAHALDLVGERWALLVVRELLLGPKRFTDLRAAVGLSASYELHLDEDVFRVAVSDGRFEVARGEAEQPDATIEAGSATLATLVYEGRPLAEALRSGDLRIEGDESAVERFLTLFPLPEPAATAGV